MGETEYYKEKADAYERAYNIAQTKYTIMERISYGIKRMNGLKGLDKGTKVYIYGAGTIGKFLYKTLKSSEQVDILGYIERDNSGKCEGVSLLSLKESELFDKEALIVITPMEYYDDILKDMKERQVCNKVLSVLDIL